MVFEQTFLEPVEFTDTKKPKTPQYKVENPLKKDIFVNSIVMTAGLGFITKGKVLITINDVPIFSPTEKLQFENTPSISIPLNDKPLLRNNSVKVFGWNSIDSGLIKLSVEVKLSERMGSAPSNSGAASLSITPEDVRRRNSIIETIFAQDDYLNETQTFLLDMLGYTKLVLIISAQNYSGPTALAGDITTNIQNTTDGDLDSFGSGTRSVGPTPVIQSYDFGSIATRDLKLKMQGTTGLGSVRGKLEYSDDNVIWTLGDSLVFNSGDPLTTLVAGLVSFRYARGVVENVSASGTMTLVIYEMYDNNKFGGLVDVSFELLNPADNQWVVLIPSSAIGSVSQGNTVVKTIGDVVQDVSNDKFNYSLPSTATNLRIVMTITSGGINTGVSIMKID